MAKKKTAKKKTVKKKKALVSIGAVKHKNKRANIPTEELRDFVAEDELKPKDVKLPGLLYARDPSLDPQLVWKGKDEQDREELTVPAVPIYIQEKIHPQSIIEEIRAQSKEDSPEPQLDLFGDFNGIDFEELIEFYKHQSNWSNRMILGDSLLTMTSLAEKESLKGQVQMVYIDPPYGIKFGSNWQVSTRKRDVKDGAADATRQPEQIRAFRDTWELGIHSYLSYWRDRLVAARELLTETGSVFVQIGVENVHLLRCLMDEVFGTDNFLSQISYASTSGFETSTLSRAGDYIIWYAKNKNIVKYRPLYTAKKFGDVGSSGYDYLELDAGVIRTVSAEEKEDISMIPRDARLLTKGDMQSQGPASEAQDYFFQGKMYRPNSNSHWKPNHPDGLDRLKHANRIVISGKTLRYKRFFDDFPVIGINNLWSDQLSEQSKIYVVQTAQKIIERCVLLATDPGDLVLDPTCGSGTTAYVAEQWGRRWITIDTSRVSLALARTRLMTAKFPYYLLSDSSEGIKKEAEITGHTPPPYKTESDIRKGFVCKRVPHVMLKDIANNAEIDTIHDKYQGYIEPFLVELSKLLKKKWQEWEVPRESEKDWPKEAKNKLEKLWNYRLRKQKEIDESIALNSEQEILCDQPYEDNKKLRVTGPFTFESLSPHRTISVKQKKQLAEKPNDLGFTTKMLGAAQFGNIMIDNLKRAGIQNTIKNERLKFDSIEVHAGQWIHAIGDYTEKDGKAKRAAICIGPEHGTVGPELIKEAAKEAVQGIGYDLLIICGFAFDPHVSEEARRYGKLTVLPTRINADLMLGEEFLKKTGAGNLFMVFGEPDIVVNKAKDGKVQVEIKGLDIYDPTTGQIRSNTTDDIACWFIDTNYNEESFFVRHAYFTGAGEPYKNLQRALKAEINEEAWQSLYSTISKPFDKPKTGKIAIKVINHYGDEVLKVYEIEK